MNKFFNKFKNNKGNSLAEFAVTAAMMATLATTAAPAFSGVADAAKEKQTFANMDRIAGMINQYYSNKSASVGTCLLYTSPSPRDLGKSRMPSSA